MKKKIFKDFLTSEEGADVSKAILDKFIQIIFLERNTNSIISKIVDKLIKEYDCKIGPSSYCKIENKPEGHPWHIDTGTDGHMEWCNVGASIILENPISGGDTYYADNQNGDNKIKVKRDQYDLVSHTSDVWHMVEQNSGERTVLLIFI